MVVVQNAPGRHSRQRVAITGLPHVLQAAQSGMAIGQLGRAKILLAVSGEIDRAAPDVKPIAVCRDREYWSAKRETPNHSATVTMPMGFAANIVGKEAVHDRASCFSVISATALRQQSLQIAACAKV